MTNLTDTQKALLKALSADESQDKRNKGAMTLSALSEQFSGWDQHQLVDHMNKLSALQLVEFVTVGSELAFRARNTDEINKTANMDTNERIIYSYIKAAGNKGIWIKDIKSRSQMHTQVVNATIKSLEKKNIIKSVKPVKNSIRKVYMLFELEPSVEITGGAWYTGSEFDTEFVDALATQIFKYISSKSFPKNKNAIFPSNYTQYPTVSHIYKFIRQSGITSVELSRNDVQELVDRLVFDGKIIKRLGAGSHSDSDSDYNDEPQRKKRKRDVDEEDEEVLGTVDGPMIHTHSDAWMYVAVKEQVMSAGWTDTPCGRCPVFSFCADKGPVTPYKCVYYKSWLSEF